MSSRKRFFLVLPYSSNLPNNNLIAKREPCFFIFNIIHFISLNTIKPLNNLVSFPFVMWLMSYPSQLVLRKEEAHTWLNRSFFSQNKSLFSLMEKVSAFICCYQHQWGLTSLSCIKIHYFYLSTFCF